MTLKEIECSSPFIMRGELYIRVPGCSHTWERRCMAVKTFKFGYFPKDEKIKPVDMEIKIDQIKK